MSRLHRATRPAHRHVGRLGVFAAVAAVLAGCAGVPEVSSPCATPAGDPGQAGVAEQLRVEVIGTHPHDPGAFTQGLLLHDELLYESTGLTGQSTVREVDPETGQVLRRADLTAEQFGEGLERVDDQLIQLTWQAGVANVYALDTFAKTGELAFEGEGWGLCHDGARLVMSDGSDVLTFRDPETFEPVGTVAVTIDGRPVEQLNELECVGDVVYANVWQTDSIVKIDPATGEVRAVIDASGLPRDGDWSNADVLNGIAYRPDHNTFLITGKRWPTLYEACFVAAGGE